MNDVRRRRELTPEEYEVIHNKGTEPPFSGEYVDKKDDGTYACKACGVKLFSSQTKYDSGSGWPSFHSPMKNNAVTLRPDSSLGLERTEVTCSNCGAHLGHVFEDGPAPTGQRYCINSLALKFEDADLE